MARKATAKSSAPTAVLPDELVPRPATTTPERLAEIQVLAKKVVEHSRAVAALKDFPYTSDEARDHTVLLFHERIRLLERALDKILEDLRLG